MTLPPALKALLLTMPCLNLFGCASKTPDIKIEQRLKTSRSWREVLDTGSIDMPLSQ